MPALLLQDVTVTLDNNTYKHVVLVVNLLACVICCYRSRLVFNCCFETLDISQGSVATHLRCGGIFSDSIITRFLLILTMK